MPPTISHPVGILCILYACVAFSREKPNRLLLRFRQVQPPCECAEVTAGTGAYNYFSIICSQQIANYGNVIEQAYHEVNKWFAVGSVQLDRDDFANLVKQYSCRSH